MVALALANALFADDAPLPFPVDVEAQPIAAQACETPLRWKTKAPGKAATIGRGSSNLTASTGRGFADSATTGRGYASNGWNITRVDPSVRPAQATSDPFSDPFGDQQASHDEPLLLQPTQAEANIEELPPPRETVAPRLNSPTNARLAAQPPREPVIPNPDFDAQPLIERPPTPCERIYNDRNCCDVEMSCREFRNRLLSDPIRNISLDITPRYSPDLTVEEDLAERADKLRLLESRAWRDRQGNVVATGRMANIVNDAVIVVDDTGRETGRIPLQQLGEDEMCYVTAWWRLPAECTLGGIALARREWVPSLYAWHASALCHKPLYFEEVQLERYGHTTGPFTQPIVSGAHFFLNVAVLPYKMGINPPHECQYALGYYRPGSCAPWMVPPIPLSLRGAAAQTAAVLGGVYLFP